MLEFVHQRLGFLQNLGKHSDLFTACLLPYVVYNAAAADTVQSILVRTQFVTMA